MPKIIGLSIPFPGARRPLEEGAKLGLWEFVLLQGERVKIPPADVYIFAAYHPIYERLFTLGGKNVILWTSSAGEMDMEPIEQQFLDRLLKDPRVSTIWFGDQSLALAYPEKGFYAPYPLACDIPPEVEKQDIITLFCPAGPKKNILNQLLAAKLVQREMHLTLHTNIRGYDGIISELDCVRHDWLPDGEYQRLLAQSKVNLAISWCETFNYQVAEAALCGTCSLVSETIPVPGMVITNPNNPALIAQGIIEVAQKATELGQDASQRVRQFAQYKNEELKEIIKRL